MTPKCMGTRQYDRAKREGSTLGTLINGLQSWKTQNYSQHVKVIINFQYFESINLWALLDCSSPLYFMTIWPKMLLLRGEASIHKLYLFQFCSVDFLTGAAGGIIKIYKISITGTSWFTATTKILIRFVELLASYHQIRSLFWKQDRVLLSLKSSSRNLPDKLQYEFAYVALAPSLPMKTTCTTI